MKAKEKIITAAEEIFTNYSYDNATVKLICDLAKVNIASVNYHFRSKKDLYLEVISSIHNRINDKERKVFDIQVTEVSQQSWEQFISDIASTISGIPEDADINKWHKIVFRELSNPSEIFNDIYELYFLPILEHINSSIKRFFPDLPEDEQFMWVLSLISQASFIHSSRSLITKYRGPEFYSKKNTDKYASHITKTICSAAKVESVNS